MTDKVKYLPGLPLLDNVYITQLQFFDNSELPAKQGKSPYCLKLRMWTKDYVPSVTTVMCDWMRPIQLLELPKFMKGVDKMFARGDMTQEQYNHYGVVLQAMQASGIEMEWLRAGHVDTPPGKQYYPGQFVVFAYTAKGNGYCVVNRQFDLRDYVLQPTKKVSEGKSKQNAAKLYCLDDPLQTVAKSIKRQIAEANVYRKGVA